MTNKEIFMEVFGKNPENLKRKASTIEWWDQEFIDQPDCGDCISRKAVLDLQYRIDDSATLSTRDVVNVDEIEDLPPVNPQPKTGHWKHNKCDVCGASRPPLFNNYCPNCGAKMVEPQESEEIETWNGIHAQITAPKGTFERIFNDADDDNDI